MPNNTGKYGDLCFVPMGRHLRILPFTCHVLRKVKLHHGIRWVLFKSKFAFFKSSSLLPFCK